MNNIILASKSPRRREIMDKLNIEYKVIVSDIKEVMDESLAIEDRIKDLALKKALAVYEDHKEDLVIGADTVVEADGVILGKPRNETEAYDMIRKLSGRTHRVITAVAMVTSKWQYLDHDVTGVTFTNIGESEIRKYVKTDEPYDKAGAYAIQGWAGRYISRIEGSYYTVMGLPLHMIYLRLKEAGYIFDRL